MRFWLKIQILGSPFRTQSDLAKAIKKSDHWLSSVIHGRIDPNEKEKELIASALKTVPSERLFLDTEHWS